MKYEIPKLCFGRFFFGKPNRRLYETSIFLFKLAEFIQEEKSFNALIYTVKGICLCLAFGYLGELFMQLTPG